LISIGILGSDVELIEARSVICANVTFKFNIEFLLNAARTGHIPIRVCAIASMSFRTSMIRDIVSLSFHCVSFYL
jgi:hypothetical protein